jgi:predicted DNA binding CopG/RHH family protein
MVIMPTPTVNLTPEEQDILNSIESGEWEPVENRDAEITRYQQYARATLKKDKRVNIRISQANLEVLQKSPRRRHPLTNPDRQHFAQIYQWSPRRAAVK